MYSERVVNLVNQLLNDESCTDILDLFIHKYARQSLDHAIHLHDSINDVLSIALKHIEKESEAFRTSTYMLINGRDLLSSKKTKTPDTKFAMMLPVCKVYFPDGVANEHFSFAERTFFEEFLSLFNDSKVFSWDNPDDVSWANMYGYTDYLKKVQANLQIKENFEDVQTSSESS